MAIKMQRVLTVIGDYSNILAFICLWMLLLQLANAASSKELGYSLGMPLSGFLSFNLWAGIFWMVWCPALIAAQFMNENGPMWFLVAVNGFAFLGGLFQALSSELSQDNIPLMVRLSVISFMIANEIALFFTFAFKAARDNTPLIIKIGTCFLFWGPHTVWLFSPLMLNSIFSKPGELIFPLWLHNYGPMIGATSLFIGGCVLCYWDQAFPWQLLASGEEEKAEEKTPILKKQAFTPKNMKVSSFSEKHYMDADLRNSAEDLEEGIPSVLTNKRNKVKVQYERHEF